MNTKEKSIDSVLLTSVPGNLNNIVESMKSGAHLLLICDVKDHHESTISAEDNGLEIRDTLAYVFAEGGDNAAMKLVAMARKPLQGTVAENVMKWWTGGLNIDTCRVYTKDNLNGGAYAKSGSDRYDGDENWRFKRKGDAGEYAQPEGRWPANLTHDNSPNVVAMFPDAKAGCGNGNAASGVPGSVTPLRRGKLIPRKDSGSAARFFYSAPCLNDLCSYLVRLITPPNGYILIDCEEEGLPSNYNYVWNYVDKC